MARRTRFRQLLLTIGMVEFVGGAIFLVGLALPLVIPWHYISPRDEPEKKGPLRPAVVRIPKGTFLMGSPTTEPGHDRSERRHEVRIDHAFELCQTEVTVGQWLEAMGELPHDEACLGSSEVMKEPVRCVSWEQAVDYFEAVSELEGLEPCYERDGDEWIWNRGCDGYRFPTEAEWEYAVRSGAYSAYFYGDEVEDLSSYAWYDENSDSLVHEVGRKRASRLELYDVYGNVGEWTWDWYQEDYGDESADPIGPEHGDQRVVRGGTAGDRPMDLRSARRRPMSPEVASERVGLRCARGRHPEPRL